MSCYMLATGKGRHFPPHGYTPTSILETRFRENTTAAALSLTVVIPFLQRVNKSVEQHIDSGVEVSSSDVKNIAKESAIATLYTFTEGSSRTAIQALIASFFIGKKDTYLDSVVFSWDHYPRLHQKYCGDLLAKLYLPRFIATLLGPKTNPADLDFFRTPSLSPIVVLEDSFKRNVIATTADVIVDSVKALLFQNNKGTAILKSVVMHSSLLVSHGAGAVVGHSIKGDVGEYWGERLGSIFGALIAVQLLAKLSTPSKKQQKSK